MEEVVELRVYKKYAHLLLDSNEGRDLGSFVAITLNTKDPKFEKARYLTKKIREDNNDFFFLYSEIKRKYSNRELESAELFHMKIVATFEPAGEECGTVYDEITACDICGANRQQVSKLKLKRSSIPRKDIARTIAGEIVISTKFIACVEGHRLIVGPVEPVMHGEQVSDFSQLIPSCELELTGDTVAGINVFDLSEEAEGFEFETPGARPSLGYKEVYKCPKGHTLGLNLLSEPHVINSPSIDECDVFSSKQKIGVKRGLLRPQPIYLCSPRFRKMVIEEKLTGFEFEIAHIDS